MAVVTKYGTGYRDPASLKAIEGVQRAAEYRGIKSRITITNGDSIASLFYLGSIPSNAKLDPSSTIYTQAITGAACNIGFYNPNGGAVILATALAAAQSLAAAVAVTLQGATGSGVAVPANMDKAAWQLAGLSVDPGGELDIVLALTAAATATGDVYAELRYGKGA